jgi:uncharacterized protein with HEPN domain
MRERCASVALVVARGRAAFDEDELLRLALGHALELLGEAANHVSDTARADYPSIPWTQITRLRIRLAHHYHRVDPSLLWTIAKEEIPRLAEALGPIVEESNE